MMFTMPVYDMMLLPGVTFYFKKDIFLHVLRNRSGFNAVLIVDKNTFFPHTKQTKHIFFL